MHMPIQRMSPLTRISIAVYDWATALTATVVVLGNGMSWSVGWPLISFGLLVDLNRFTSARFPNGLAYRSGPLCIPVRVYLRPLWTVYIMAASVVALLLLYYAIPGVCWPAFNSWVEANFSIVKFRFQGFPYVCDVPHGAVLLLAQMAVPIVIVLGVAIPLSSARFDPVKFLDDLERDTRGHIRRADGQPDLKPVRLGAAIAVAWTFILAVGFISFTPDNSNIHARPLRPQSSVHHLLLWFVLMLFPQTMFIHLSAGGRAVLRICEHRSQQEAA